MLSVWALEIFLHQKHFLLQPPASLRFKKLLVPYFRVAVSLGVEGVPFGVLHYTLNVWYRGKQLVLFS